MSPTPPKIPATPAASTTAILLATSPGMEQVTSNVSDADFILAHGTEAVGQSGGPAVETPLDDMKAMMAEAAARKLPMIVANPDVVRACTGGGMGAAYGAAWIICTTAGALICSTAGWRSSSTDAMVVVEA
eukprot:352986-Chlamydomonas_euryale.AAC.4